MPEFYVDEKGCYHYNNEKYSKCIIPTNVTIKNWNPKIVSYYESLYSKKLPVSPIEELLKDQITNRGYYNLDGCEQLSSEQNKFGNNFHHEIAWPQRVGIKKDDGTIYPYYFKPHNTISGGKDAVDKIIENVFRSKVYPIETHCYAGIYNGKLGTISEDLNHIPNTKTLRLDKYLESKGVELESVIDIIKAYNEGVFKEDLTDLAIAQLIFSQFILPNVLNEQDPNTRNAILMGSDQKDAKKYKFIGRIDFENNAEEDKYTIPFGIFNRGEQIYEFKENLKKAVTDKLLTPKDINLINSMYQVAEYITRNTNADNIVESIRRAHKLPLEYNHENIGSVSDYFTYTELVKFGEKSHKYAKNHINGIKNTINEIGCPLSNDLQLPSL